MKLPALAIKYHQFTIVVVLLLVLSGLTSFIVMPRSENPPVSKPGTSIIVIYPGATPKDMEKLVVSPLEESLNELDNIKKIDSKSESGYAFIAVEFIAGSDPDKKFSDVNEKVNSKRTVLPKGITTLKTVKWTIEDTNFIQIALVSKYMQYRELEGKADLLKKELEKVSGIRKVQSWAFPKQQVKIDLDLEKLARSGIPVSRILGILRSNNMNIPGGNLKIGGKSFSVETSSSYGSVNEIGDTIIHSDGKKVIRLRNISDISFDYEKENYLARYDGQRAVFVTASQKTGTNIFNVIKKVRKKISDFENNIPSGLKLYFVYDQSIGVNKRLSGFFINMIQGIILVGIIVLFMIGLRGSIIVMVAIPISIFIAMGFIDLSGFGIQQMTIAGLVITLGLLVDNAIVVTENISRFIQAGETKLNAALKGTTQIGWPIVSATFTTVLAFVPIVMMKDVSGDFVRSMPVTVIYTLIASLLIALTFTPFLSTKLLRKEPKKGKIMKATESFVNGRYMKWLDTALKRPKTVIVIVVLVFLGSLALFPLIGVTFFPKADKYEFLIDVSTPEGTNLFKTDEIVKKIEGILEGEKIVKHFTSNVGHSNPRIFYNVIEKEGKSNIAQIFVKINEIGYSRMEDFIDKLRNKFRKFPGVRIDVKRLEMGPPYAAPIEFKILGKRLDILTDIASDVENIFKNTSGVININNPLKVSKTNIKVDINRDKASLMGISLAEIDRMVRLAIEGIKVSSFRDENGKEYDIMLGSGATNGKNDDINIFQNIYVKSVTGSTVPFSQLAKLKFKSSPTVVNRFNLERSVALTADVDRGYSVNRITTEIERKLEKYKWPSGYNYFVGGEKEGQEEAFGGMGKAVIIAIIAIFATLVLQFRSFIQPLIVFSALPLAIIGSILTLFITGFSFSFTAFVGLTSLVGIVVNNSIILVDYTNILIDKGKHTVDALKSACRVRFVPIILTTFTTIGGLLPLTLGGGDMWGPMGWTIIGGLLVSTFLTLLVVPVLYKLYTKAE